MSAPGRRHRLLLYMYILDRWWRLVFFIGLVLLALAFCLRYIPSLSAGMELFEISSASLGMIGTTGIIAILLAIFLATVRYFAYVQPFEDHLRLVTPFLRLKISYRRIRQTGTDQVGRLFPPPQKKSRRAILQSLSPLNAIVLDMNGFPLPKYALLFFLSPLFFPDQTSRLALLVPDWISFSNELESYRSAWLEANRQNGYDPHQELFSSLSNWDDDGGY